MKRRFLSLVLVLAMTFVCAQGVFAAAKKKLTKEEIAKKMETAKLNNGKGEPIDPAILLTLEAQRKKNGSSKNGSGDSSKDASKKSSAEMRKTNAKNKLNDLKANVKDTVKIEAEKKAREAALELVKIGEKQLPEELFNLYIGTTFVNTTQETIRDINKMISQGAAKLPSSTLEQKLLPIFDTAAKDSSEFAAGVLKKYSLQGLVDVAITKPESLKDVKNAVKNEIEQYAKQELNKLANQVVAQIIPELELLTIDFTKLDPKNLKASLRSMAINALSQSYLGPGYVALYVAFEMLFPKEAAKVHAELRRFDKKYLQPYTNAYEDAISTAVEKYTAEVERFGKRVGKEIEREVKDVKEEAARAGKRLENEAKREAEDVKKAAKSAESAVKNEAKRAEKSVKKAAKKVKKKLRL
jgi:outer membrane murein-binding lipoprotein Lpp